MEDKQQILRNLIHSLSLTRAAGGNDGITDIKVFKTEHGDEYAQVILKGQEDIPLEKLPRDYRFCITGDSGIACIYDFCNWAKAIW